MIKESFDAIPHESGSSYVVTIPRYYFRAGVLDPMKKYRFTIEEISSENNSEDSQEAEVMN